jgi:hypothetical protein
MVFVERGKRTARQREVEQMNDEKILQPSKKPAAIQDARRVQGAVDAENVENKRG